MRKDEHLQLALIQNEITNDFDKMRFVHNAINDISFTDVSLKTKICNKNINYPIYINAMTGGTKTAYEVNEKLAILANHFNLPIATGSLSIALKDPSLIDTFKIVRRINPKGIVIANIGADKNYEEAIKVIKILKADILQIHLNIVQEIIMPEGTRDFTSFQKNIKEIIENVKIPVIVKEVGFGMSYKTYQKLKELGVKHIDISGTGGTNFAIIENARRSDSLTSLNSYGISTVEALLEATKMKGLFFYASGGIRNPMDVVKSLALGAKAVGMSAYFLKLITNNSLNISLSKFNNFLLEISSIMAVLGKREIKELTDTEIVFDESLINYMKQRDINLSILNKR